MEMARLRATGGGHKQRDSMNNQTSDESKIGRSGPTTQYQGAELFRLSRDVERRTGISLADEARVSSNGRVRRMEQASPARKF